MQRTLVFVIAFISSSMSSADSINSVAKPLGKHIETISRAFACEVMAGTPGINNAPQCRDSNSPVPVNSRDFDKVANKKTLRECMKPDNLIDDDVRKCMKGL